MSATPPNRWSLDEMTIVLEVIEGDTAQVRVTTPVGDVRILADVDFQGRELHFSGVHIEGLSPGAAQLAGLNRIGDKLQQVFDVDRIYIAGASRTTGARPGHRPKVFRYPRHR